MNAIGQRINGQSEYQPANQNRAAWREEMLDDLLSQMRTRQLPSDTHDDTFQQKAIPGKGSYVDLYV